jgi:hypothetical protein
VVVATGKKKKLCNLNGTAGCTKIPVQLRIRKVFREMDNIFKKSDTRSDVLLMVSNISDVRVEPFHTNESQMITAFSHIEYNVSANSELTL